MDPMTASMIFKQRVDKYIYAVCVIAGPKNNKRFYIAKETEESGSIIKHCLLISKPA
jgi:hypothetical protein